MQIFHPEHGTRQIASVDWTQAWRDRGWSDTEAPMQLPTPPTGTPDTAMAELDAAAEAAAPALDVFSAVARLAELKEIYDADGKRDWKAIKAIADPLGVKKHPDGWDSSLLRIIEAEYSPAIAAALAQEAEA